jgi:ribosomal protein S3
MGQKIKPIGLRVGINRTWDSRWYAGRNYGELLHKDIELRSYLMDRLKQAAISRVVIERPAGRARVTIHAGRPGLIIGKKGQDIERLRADLSKKVGSEVSLNIVEVRKPEIDAKLIAENIAQQLERRVGFRRAMKRAVQSAIANAENNHSLDVDRLFVKEADVGKALVMKRFKARARGRGARILKPFSHLLAHICPPSDLCCYPASALWSMLEDRSQLHTCAPPEMFL